MVTLLLCAYQVHAISQDDQRRLRPRKKRISRVGRNVVPGSYIVQVQRSADVKGILADYGLRAFEMYRHALTGFAVENISDRTMEELLIDPRVTAVAEDGRLDEEQEESQQPPVQVQSPATWNLDRIDGIGGDLEYQYRYNGTGVHVYILDSGIRATNNEFDNRVVTDCFDQVGPCNSDTNGHGTHVAGIVGGRRFGVAKGVTLHDVRIRDEEENLRWAYLYAGFDYVIEERRRYPDRKLLINVSYSGRYKVCFVCLLYCMFS